MVLMKRETIIIVFLSLATLLAIVLVGNGITGMAVFGENIKEQCEQDTECNNPAVCCRFYEKEAGVCHSKGMCTGIEDLTKSEFEDAKNTQVYTQVELQKSMAFQILFGLMIFLVAGFAIYVYVHHHQLNKNKSSKKKAKK